MFKRKNKIPNKKIRKELRENIKSPFFKREIVLFQRIGLLEKALFAKHLSVMLRSGLNIIEALEITVDESKGAMKRVLRGVLRSVNAGNALSLSLAKYPKIFSPFFVNSVRVGEVSGTLEDNFLNISEQLGKEQKLRLQIKGALLYPAVVLIASFLLGFGVFFFIIPKLLPLFTGLRIDLPLATRALIFIGNFMNEYGIEFFIFSILASIFIIWISRLHSTQPFTHWLILHTPVFSMISRNANMVRFTRTLGTLLRSGLNIDEGLHITSKTVENFYYRHALAKMSKQIRRGRKLSVLLDKFPHLFPKITTNMIRVGEESGRLDDSLLYLSDIYEFEIDTSIKSMTTIIEPILLLLIGVVVAFLAVAVITPIYEITGNVQLY